MAGSVLLARDPQWQKTWEKFQASALCPPHTMDFFQVDGFLRALACAPEPLDHESRWQRVLNDQELSADAPAETDKLHLLIEALYQYHLEEVQSEQCNLPCCAVYASLQSKRVDLEQWARGFLQGYIVREEQWSKVLNCVTNARSGHRISKIVNLDEFDAIVSIVSTVADAKYAVYTGTDPEDLERIFESLPDSIVRFGVLGASLKEVALAGKPLGAPA